MASMILMAFLSLAAVQAPEPLEHPTMWVHSLCQAGCEGCGMADTMLGDIETQDYTLHPTNGCATTILPQDRRTVLMASQLWLGCEIRGALQRHIEPVNVINSIGAKGSPQLYKWDAKMIGLGLNPDSEPDRLHFGFWLVAHGGWAHHWVECSRLQTLGQLPEVDWDAE